MGLAIVTCFIPGALREETANAIHDAITDLPDVTWHQHVIDPANDYEYGLVLRDYWDSATDDLFVIESDIVVNPDTIQSFIDCPNWYCASSYAWLTNVGPALGCTRFRREFMQKYPDAMDEAQKRCTWRQLDVTLQRAILVRIHGEQPCVDHGIVEHLGPKGTLLPDADPTPLRELPAW